MPMRTAALGLCLTTAAGAAAAAPATAQRVSSGAAAPVAAAGRVLPDRPPDLTRVPAPLRADAAESLRRLAAAARRNDALARPAGFDVEWGARALGGAQSSPVRLAVSATLRPRAGNGGASLDVAANAIEPALAGDAWGSPDEHGRQLSLEPKRDGTAGGFPRYGSGVVVVTRVARPLWVPVSRERAIRAEIGAKRAFIDQLLGPGAQQLRQQLGQQSSDSALQEWVRQRPQRERAFQQAYAQAKKRDPVYAERLRVSHERMEAEYEKQMRATKEQLPAIDRATDDNKREAEKCIRLLEDHLASLSPAQRATPAAISVSLDAWTHRNALAWSRGCSTVAAAPGRETRLIVEPNPDFFDRTQPRSAIQLVVVGTDILHATGNANASRAFAERVSPRVTAGIDWAAFAALLAGR